MSKTLTDQQIVDCARNVLARHFKPEEWVDVSSVYTRLFANPVLFGAPDVYSLPKIERFERVCEVMFEHDYDVKGNLMIRAGK